MNLNALLGFGPLLVDNSSFISYKNGERVGEMDSTSVGIWDFHPTSCFVSYDI